MDDAERWVLAALAHPTWINLLGDNLFCRRKPVI
jgi:hypothetical protein